MAFLNLVLQPKDARTFEVYVVGSGSDHKSSKLPFFEGGRDYRSTLIRVLEITAHRDATYDANRFRTHEQAWLVKAGILDEERQSFLDYPDLLKNLGKELYRSLCPDDSLVQKVLEREWDNARNKGEVLQVQLEFQSDSVKQNRVADYPWELVHDGDKFLAFHKVSFSRYIAYSDSQPKLPRVDKANVLLVASKASDKTQGLSRLSDSEREAIREGLELACEEGHINLIDLAEEKGEVTFEALQKYLTEHREEDQPHILHFDGHGLYGKQCPDCQQIYPGITSENCENSGCKNRRLREAQGYLVFESSQGDPHYVSAEELGTVLQNMTSGERVDHTGRLSLVVLSACQSGIAAAEESVFNGTAQKLIEHSIPAVVAMQYSVGVEAAKKFAQHFYTALGQKDTLAQAVSQARISMGVSDNQWYRPVLYLRWRDNEGGQLFAQSKTKSTPKFKPPNNTPSSSAKSFIGRDELLEELRKLNQDLEKNSENAATFIHGVGGVGKTELAIQYAKIYEDQYPGGICWFSQENEDDKSEVGNKILQFALTHFRLNSEGNNLSYKVDKCWNYWPIEGDVLVIVDNVTKYDKLKDYLKIPIREKRFKVLIVVLMPHNLYKDLLVDPLEPEAALDILKSLIGVDRVENEKEEAKKICSYLGYLPLALKLMGGFLTLGTENKGMKLEEAFELLNDFILVDEINPGVKPVFDLSWTQIEKFENAELVKFLGYLFSLFSQAPISWSLIESIVEKRNKSIKDRIVKVKSLEFSALPRLIALGFIKQYQENPTDPKNLKDQEGQKDYQVHEIIRQFLEEKLAKAPPEEFEGVGGMREKFRQAMVDEALKISATPTHEELNAVKFSIPHITKVAIDMQNSSSELQGDLETSEIIEIYLGLGRFYEGNGVYDIAKEWYKKYQDMGLEIGSPSFVKAQNALAYINLLQGNYSESKRLYHEAYIEGDKWFKEHKHGWEEAEDFKAWMNENFEAWRNLVQSQDGWGYLIFYSEKDHKSSLRSEQPANAKKLLEDALCKKKKLSEKLKIGSCQKQLEDLLLLDIATNHEHLGHVNRSNDNFDKAEEHYGESLENRRRSLPESHPLLAESSNNLGMYFYDKGFKEGNRSLLKESEKLFINALEMHKRMGKTEHYDFALISLHLADLYLTLNPGEVQKQCDTVLEIARKISKQILTHKRNLIIESLRILVILYSHGKDQNTRLVESYCNQGLKVCDQRLEAAKKQLLENEQELIVQIEKERQFFSRKCSQL